MSDAVAVVPPAGAVTVESSYKSPPVILGAINTAMIVGVSAYYYKRLENVEKTMKSIEETQKIILEKLKEVSTSNKTNSDTITILNNEINTIQETLENDFDGLVATLEECGVTYEKESEKHNARSKNVNTKRSTNMKSQKHEEDSFVEQEDVDLEDVKSRIIRNRQQQRR